MIKLNILKGRIVLPTLNGMVEVKPLTRTHLIKYMGYYDRDAVESGEDPYVYIYRGKLKRTDIKIPGSIYKIKDDKLIWVEHDPDKKETFHLSNCKELSKELIRHQLDNPNVQLKEINPELLEAVDGEIFTPMIRDTDDILKRVIKTTLQNMKINLKSLKHKFNNDYDLNNLKSQLLKPGAMSSKYFQKWAEVLDIDVEVIVRDKPGFEKLRDEITIILK